jgi:plastocyanin
MNKRELAVVLVGFFILLGVLGFVYMQQTANFASEVSKVTSSIFAMQSASTTAATSTTATTSTLVTTNSQIKSSAKTSGSVVVSHTVGVSPKITKFEPAAATVGTTVTIIGTGFDSKINYITFGTYAGRHHQDGTAGNVIATQGSADGKTLTFVVPASSASGLLCDSTNHCIGVSAMRITPGNYPVTIQNKNGTSAVDTFTVTAQ